MHLVPVITGTQCAVTSATVPWPDELGLGFFGDAAAH